MPQFIKQHSRLFLCLFTLPVLWHVGFWQIRLYSNDLLFSFLPKPICLAIYGLILGSWSGLISIAIAALLFTIFPNWTHLKKQTAMYAFCWLVPFCLMSVFGFAMWADPCGSTHTLPALEVLRNGLMGLTIAGISGGAVGIIAFLATSLPGFKERYSFPTALLIFLSAFYIKNSWLLPVVRDIPFLHVPVEIAIYPIVCMFSGGILERHCL